MTEPQPKYIISPLSQCASPEKQERFLDYIRKIAPVTEANEPDCETYAWFRSAEDNDVVPKHWLRGFEVYKHPEASTVTHRSSDEYKAFRAAVGSEGLLERPSDLRPWYSTGLGFTRSETERGSGAESQYVIVNEIRPKKGAKNEILEILRKFLELSGDVVTSIHAMGSLPSLSSFTVLDRGNQVDQDTGEADEGLYVFLRTDSKEYFDSYIKVNKERGVATFEDMWEHIEKLCEWRRKTTWVACNIGFIGPKVRDTK